MNFNGAGTQTFDTDASSFFNITNATSGTLQLTNQKVSVKAASNEIREMPGYDLTRETQYYDSFSYKSELRVLKDMAFIDVLALDKERIGLQLVELNKVKNRFKELWQNYHQHYHDYHQDYKSSYPFTIRLDTLFIVHNLQGDSADVHVSAQFVEDLADSIKLRELFLKELIQDTEATLKKTEPATNEISSQSEDIQLSPQETIKPIIRYPIFTDGTTEQFFNVLKPYFSQEDHSNLSDLLFKNIEPDTSLIFRGNGNQLADAFKQLFDNNIIVGCLQTDLEKWIAPKFLYLSGQGHPRELTEDYLNSLISTKTRPCKSPILKIEQKEAHFLILPAPRNKK